MKVARTLHLSFLLAYFPFIAQGQDLFPETVSPLHSKFWTVQYADTYKIATNLVSNTSYLLYQNGTEPPSDQIGLHNAVIEIPLLGDVGLTDITPIAFLELLGVQTRVKAFLGDKSYIASPCFLELIGSGSIIDFNGNASVLSAVSKAGINASSLVTFAYTYAEIGAIVNKVFISEYEEKTSAGVFEWLKFYSLFFNLEAEANRLTNETYSRALCVEQNAAAITADNPNRPVVLWAYYEPLTSGWSVATCPNYYCEIASACSSTLVPAVNGSIEDYGTHFLTDEEFLKFGKDAEFWIFPSNDWDNTFGEKKSILSQFKSVKNQKVFDYQGYGKNAWFEERYVEYDVVIQDFCTIVGKFLNHKRVWFRNVFTEAKGNLGQCRNASAPLQIPATQCVPDTVSAVPLTQVTTTSSALANLQHLEVVVWVLASVVGVLVLL